MIYRHETLAQGRWRQFSLMEQLAHVGSDVIRAMRWKEKDRPDYSWGAFERALELLELTIADPKNRTRLRELTRLQEALADYFAGENLFQSTPKSWETYFDGFGYAALRKGGFETRPYEDIDDSVR